MINSKKITDLKFFIKLINKMYLCCWCEDYLKTTSNISSKRKISKGLNNIGDKDYLNSILQCLINTKNLRDYFLETYKTTPNKKLANEFHELILNLWEKNIEEKSYSPKAFKQVLNEIKPLSENNLVQEPKDLINSLLEILDQELKEVIDNNNQIQQIPKLFFCNLKKEYLCKECNSKIYIYKIFDFPLKEVNKNFNKKGEKPLKLPNNKNPDINLNECFEYIQNTDENRQQQYCNKCNKLSNELHSKQLYKASNYIIISLNRGKDSNYECNVDFPEQLNLYKFFLSKDSSTYFELYGVICRLNKDIVAYIKNDSDNEWYLYNDSKVTQCSKKYQYKEGLPHILFYQVLTN